MATKEVRFDIWCKNCTYFETNEDDEPCCDCLQQGFNEDSHKPILWKEKS